MAELVTQMQINSWANTYELGALWDASTEAQRLQSVDTVELIWQGLEWKISPFDSTAIRDKVLGALIYHSRLVLENQGQFPTETPERVLQLLEPYLGNVAGGYSGDIPAATTSTGGTGTPGVDNVARAGVEQNRQSIVTLNNELDQAESNIASNTQGLQSKVNTATYVSGLRGKLDTDLGNVGTVADPAAFRAAIGAGTGSGGGGGTPLLLQEFSALGTVALVTGTWIQIATITIPEASLNNSSLLLMLEATGARTSGAGNIDVRIRRGATVVSQEVDDVALSAEASNEQIVLIKMDTPPSNADAVYVAEVRSDGNLQGHVRSRELIAIGGTVAGDGLGRDAVTALINSLRPNPFTDADKLDIDHARGQITELQHQTADLEATEHTDWSNLPTPNAAAFKMVSFQGNIDTASWGVSHEATTSAGNYLARMRIPLGQNIGQYRLVVDGNEISPALWSEDAPDATYRYFDALSFPNIAQSKRVVMQSTSRRYLTTFKGDVVTPTRDAQPATKAYVDANAGGGGGTDNPDLTTTAATWTLSDEARLAVTDEIVDRNNVAGLGWRGIVDVGVARSANAYLRLPVLQNIARFRIQRTQGESETILPSSLRLIATIDEFSYYTVGTLSPGILRGGRWEAQERDYLTKYSGEVTGRVNPRALAISIDDPDSDEPSQPFFRRENGSIVADHLRNADLPTIQENNLSQGIRDQLGAGGLDRDEVLALVQPWARAGNADDVPASKTFDPLFTSGTETEIPGADGSINFDVGVATDTTTRSADVAASSTFAITSQQAAETQGLIRVDYNLVGTIEASAPFDLELLYRDETDNSILGSHNVKDQGAGKAEFPVGSNSGNRRWLFRVRTAGRFRGTFHILNTTFHDAEPIADSAIEAVVHPIVSDEAEKRQEQDAFLRSEIERIEDLPAIVDALPAGDRVYNVASPSFQSSSPHEQVVSEAYTLPDSGFIQAFVGNFPPTPIIEVSTLKARRPNVNVYHRDGNTVGFQFADSNRRWALFSSTQSAARYNPRGGLSVQIYHWDTSRSGVHTFTYLGLDDTPNSFAGQAGKVGIVNEAETRLEFGEPASSPTLSTVSSALGLAAPAAGNRNQIIVRKNDDTGYQYKDENAANVPDAPARQRNQVDYKMRSNVDGTYEWTPDTGGRIYKGLWNNRDTYNEGDVVYVSRASHRYYYIAARTSINKAPPTDRFSADWYFLQTSAPQTGGGGVTVGDKLTDVTTRWQSLMTGLSNTDVVAITVIVDDTTTDFIGSAIAVFGDILTSEQHLDFSASGGFNIARIRRNGSNLQFRVTQFPSIVEARAVKIG